MSVNEECAVCGGVIKGPIYSVWWQTGKPHEGMFIPLCGSDLLLGSDPNIQTQTVEELIAKRANPAWKGNAEQAVKAWIERDPAARPVGWVPPSV